MRKENTISFPIHRSQVFEQHLLGICINISLEIYNLKDMKRQQSHNTSIIRPAVFSISSCIKFRPFAREGIFLNSSMKKAEQSYAVEQRKTGRPCNVIESTIKPFLVKAQQIMKLHIFVKLCALLFFFFYAYYYFLLYLSLETPLHDVNIPTTTC